MIKRKLLIGLPSKPFSKVMVSSFIVIVSCLTSSLYAQSATAALSGTIVDEQGAVISGANVTVMNQATGLKRQTVSDSEGYFAFTQLPPTTYKITVGHAGFATAELSQVVLNVGDQGTVKIQLKIAQVGETVIVTSDTSVTNESPVVATTVNRQFVENQPLNGRSFQTLIGLSPGVVFTKTGVGTQGEFSVNGQRASTNYFMVDGVSANFGTAAQATLYETAGGGTPAYSALGSTNTLVSVDALQEFKIQTSTYAPEFGRQPGAQVSLITRSGTNQFHGLVFNYIRNDVFDANDFFGNANRLQKPALRQNDFGLTFSGPVLIPGVYEGRDHTFFFFSYEGLRLRQPFITSPTQVPSLAARQNASGIAKNLLNALPLPTGPALATDPNTATFVGGFTNPSSLDATSLRLDHNLNDRLTIFGRFNYAPSETQTRNLSSVSLFPSKTNTFTAGATMILSARMSNDLRVNYSSSKIVNRIYLDTFDRRFPLAAGLLKTRMGNWF
jgi:Carboxypeptidase regulatory-like domain/TonB-dependent Receptor Plug Domain